MKSQDRRDQILSFIREFVAIHGYSPSNREIQAGVGISSVSQVSTQLQILHAMGEVTFEEGIARTVRVTS